MKKKKKKKKQSKEKNLPLTKCLAVKEHFPLNFGDTARICALTTPLHHPSGGRFSSRGKRAKSHADWNGKAKLHLFAK